MAEQNQNDPPLEQAEFDINDIDSEVAHRAVSEAVKDLNGVQGEHPVLYLNLAYDFGM